MKKSQILAALALAFALGVVAPVAGTYAKTSGILSSDIAAFKQELDDLKEAAKTADGTVVDLDNDKKVEAYDAYKAIYDAAQAVEKAIDDAANGTKMDDAIAAVAGLADGTTAGGIMNITAAKTAINSANSAITRADGKDNEADVVYAQLNTLLSSLKKITAKTDAEQDLIDEAIDAVVEAIDAIDGAKDTAADGKFDDLFNAVSKYVDTSSLDKDDYDTVSEYNSFMTNVVKKNLTKYDAFASLFEAIATAEAYETDTEVTYTTKAQLNELNKAIEKAIARLNGTVVDGDTDTDKPGDDQNADADAPNTGALLSSDKGATTVSIVAGLATALTALGAGVVAYRNARRSSK